MISLRSVRTLGRASRRAIKGGFEGSVPQAARCPAPRCFTLPSQRTQDLLKGAQTSVLCQAAVRHRSKQPDDTKYEEDEGESSDEEDDEGKYRHLTFPEDEDLPAKYKHLKCFVPSLRVDAFISSAFNIGRNKVLDAMVAGRLQVNGVKLTKKSSRVREGDSIDLLFKAAADDDMLRGQRVRILHVSDARTKKDNIPVVLRVWRGGVILGIKENKWKDE